MRRLLPLPLLVGSIAFVVACSSKDSGSPPAEDTGPSDDSGIDAIADSGTDPFGDGPAPTHVDLAPKCGGALASDGSALKFSDQTAKWDMGADGLDVFGNHLEALDLDADGYPDLLVHSGGSARNDTSLPKKQWGWRVLMNRPKDGGGRHFVETTVESGYGAARPDAAPLDGKLRAAQLAVGADVDNDGDIDLFSGTYVDPTHPETDTTDRNEIVLNDGKGNFKLATKSDVQTVPGDISPTSSASFVDADRDGIVDVWVGFWYKSYGASSLGVQARLFKGKGDGTFVDATKGSGLETTATGYDTGKNHRPAYGVTTCDLDDDGRPELMLSAYGRQWNLLYQNATDPAGAFVFDEIGQPSGFAGDDNVDYTDNEFYKCYCKTSGKCTAGAPRVTCTDASGAPLNLWDPVNDPKPWRNNGNTFATACADFTGDGLNDLYSAEIKHWHIGNSADQSELIINEGKTDASPIHFKRPDRTTMGLDVPHPTTEWNEGGIMAANGDLDLDGREDIILAASDYPGNFSEVYRQKSDGTFEQVGEAIGLHHGCTNGVAVADFDRDGDLDVIVGSSTARDCAKLWPRGNEVHFYENALNDGANKRGYLQVKLAGKGAGKSNAAGIGARVKILVGGKVITKELTGGYGHFGMQHDTVLTFGLGTSCTPTELEVRWPDAAATKVRFTGVGGGQRILVTEDGTVTALP
jgi:hypothetical protein